MPRRAILSDTNFYTYLTLVKNLFKSKYKYNIHKTLYITFIEFFSRKKDKI